METMSEILSERMHEQTMQTLGREPLLSTTGTRAAIGLLAARVNALEETVKELTSVIRGLERTESFRGL